MTPPLSDDQVAYLKGLLPWALKADGAAVMMVYSLFESYEEMQRELLEKNERIDQLEIDLESASQDLDEMGVEVVELRNAAKRRSSREAGLAERVARYRQEVAEAKE